MSDPIYPNDEDLDDGGPTNPVYDPDEAERVNEEITKNIAASGAAVPVPEGVADQGDPELEERAARAQAGGGAQAISRDEVGNFKRSSAGNVIVPEDAFQAIMSRLDRIEAGAPVPVVRPAEAPAPDWNAPVTTPPQPAAAEAQVFLSADYAGRFRMWGFSSLEVLKGFAQNTKGTKRVFVVNPGQAEMQEIDGLGRPIIR